MFAPWRSLQSSGLPESSGFSRLAGARLESSKAYAAANRDRKPPGKQIEIITANTTSE